MAEPHTSGATGRKIRVLVADDSAVMRRAITRILEFDPSMEVVATARDGAEAIEMVATLRPDAITMDVNMPRVDGLRAVEEIMGRFPTPIVLLSAFAQPGSAVTRKALSTGAVHVMQKPSEFGIALDIDMHAEELRSRVREAARVRVVRNATFGMEHQAPVRVPKAPVLARPDHGGLPIIAIGSSTGGTVALAEILPLFPAELPACVLIVQHMPPGYTGSWARQLNEVSKISVAEARHGDLLGPARALIAPGGHHMEVRRGAVQLSAGPRVKHHRPSVDVLFDSLVPQGPRVIAALLTGMGDDGVAGMQRLHAAGAQTLVQDQRTSVVWGMAGAAVRTGCVQRQCSPVEAAQHLILRANHLASSSGDTLAAASGAGRA